MTPPLPTDTGQTAPAMVMVPREPTDDFLAPLAAFNPEIFDMDAARECWNDMLAALSSAPRPSGDVAAKLGEIRKRLLDLSERLQPGALHLTLTAQAGTWLKLASVPLEAEKIIATLEQETEQLDRERDNLCTRLIDEKAARQSVEQERTARDAEIAALKAALELERWGIDEIGSGLSSEKAYDVARMVIDRRAALEGKP